MLCCLTACREASSSVRGLPHAVGWRAAGALARQRDCRRPRRRGMRLERHVWTPSQVTQPPDQEVPGSRRTPPTIVPQRSGDNASQRRHERNIPPERREARHRFDRHFTRVRETETRRSRRRSTRSSRADARPDGCACRTMLTRSNTGAATRDCSRTTRDQINSPMPTRGSSQCDQSPEGRPR
jgi:hypothetical protein